MSTSPPLALMLLFVIGAGCGSREDPHKFWYELRAPVANGALHHDPFTSVQVVSDTSADGTRLKFMKKRVEGDFVIFSYDTLMWDGDRRRAVIVEFEDGQHAQVFRLTLPTNLEPVAWTPWAKPDYVEPEVGDAGAWLSFMHGWSAPGRSRELPSDYFEVRYRVTEWELAKSTR